MIEAPHINNVTWMTGGAQGSGVDSSSNIFARACALAGLWTFGTREYYSSIKGPHSYFQVRASSEEIRSHIDTVNVLATFDTETLVRHSGIVTPGGAIIYDPSLVNREIEKIEMIDNFFSREEVQDIKSRLEKQGLHSNVNGILEEARRRNIHLVPIPYAEVVAETADQLGEKHMTKVMKIVNVIAVSASLALLGLDESYVDKSIAITFSSKKQIVDMNVLGAKTARQHLASLPQPTFVYRLKPTMSNPRLLLMGNEAVALGKIVGGCRMQTYYPITPASDESEFLEAHENIPMIEGLIGKRHESIIVAQTEDEIAAITMATGASLTGTRAATSTSGPGFSLMVEGIGWAGMNEVPVVITLYMRAGPSTGLPTRQEQGDLKFVLSASHGEFPRIVLCSGDIEECFYDAIRALNYAEKYQLPVIHLVDKALANTSMTMIPPRSNLVPIERGKLIESSDGPPSVEPYRRFAFSEDGVSPRATLGMKGFTFWNSGDEHNEFGHISEDPRNRMRMMRKRMTKLETAAKGISEDEKVNFFQSSRQPADVTIVSWGSTKGAILDAVKLLQKDGVAAEFLQIRLASPFPSELIKQRLSKAKLVIGIEQNYSAQMASVIAEKTLLDIKNTIVKFNGRPMSQDEIYAAVRQVVSSPDRNRRVELTHGA
jgi:2-oxoglutarate/2-oxoacid ferredoxin oxidoreductase subunit alpha